MDQLYCPWKKSKEPTFLSLAANFCTYNVDHHWNFNTWIESAGVLDTYCPRRNKEMKHDHYSNQFIIWMFVFIVERYPFVVVSKYGKLFLFNRFWMAQTGHTNIDSISPTSLNPTNSTSLKTSLERPSKKAPTCAWNPWKKKVLQQEMNEKTHGPNWYHHAPSVVFDTAPDKETAEINVTYALKVPSLKNTYSHARLRPTAVWWFVWCMLLDVCNSDMT